MTATAKTRPQTWDDLAPKIDGLGSTETLTRDELLARVSALGAPVTHDRLRRWEQEERLPRPKRSGFPAKVGYPEWAVRYVAAVPALLDEGKTWDEIREVIQSNVSASVITDLVRFHGTALPNALLDELAKYADVHSARVGRQVAQIELVLRDDQGRIIGRNMARIEQTDD
jgi:hypothetical protein